MIYWHWFATSKKYTINCLKTVDKRVGDSMVEFQRRGTRHRHSKLLYWQWKTWILFKTFKPKAWCKLEHLQEPVLSLQDVSQGSRSCNQWLHPVQHRARTPPERSLLWQVETPLKVELLCTNAEILCMSLVMSRLIRWEAASCWENQTLERGEGMVPMQKKACVYVWSSYSISVENIRGRRLGGSTGEASAATWGQQAYCLILVLISSTRSVCPCYSLFIQSHPEMCIGSKKRLCYFERRSW